MSARTKSLRALALAALLLSIVIVRAWSQSGEAAPQIKGMIDEGQLSVLRGNTHPLARPEFDRGAAPASLPMEHMQLVLKRSAERERAFQARLAEQQNPSSGHYRSWLTASQLGDEFGPAREDLQKITAWLESYEFQLEAVSSARMVIEFSGAAGQVQRAFHTTIHRYVLPSGEEHWANAADPQIPTALVPVVAGVNTLNDFKKKPTSRVIGTFSRSKTTGQVRVIHRQFTFGGGCDGSGTNCYALGPYDFGTIYNALSLWSSGVTGSGQTIAAVEDSNINVSDVNTFRSLFGLSSNPPRVILPGADPGLTDDETEAVLDAEWAGAVAPGATVDIVAAPSTNTTFGGDTAAEYVVDTLSPTPAVLTYSYGACELALGTAGNQFYANLWSQAASEGITVVVSTGDNGSAGCDSVNRNQSGAQPAQYGLAVNGLASTPYGVAVGGTDFNDFSDPSTYWNASNASGTQASAKGYIPEVAYNDSCTNSILYGALGFSSAEEACNSSTAAADGLVVAAGGGGGLSGCTTSDGQTVSSCAGGYGKPSWQTGPGVPSDGKRDLPDVSLFAGDGTIQNFYIVCQSDQDPGGAACSLNRPYQDILGVGGTSVSAQAFGGVLALLAQQQGSRLGNANPTLYSLASEQAGTTCNATGSPASSCVFLDITSGTIAMPCARSSPDCTATGSGDSIGVLTGYDAASGYDLATGLGSVNIANLVKSFGPNFYLSSASPSVTIANPGASGTLSVTAYSVRGFTGTIQLACSGLPSGATCSFSPTSVTFTSSSTAVPFTVTVNTTSSSRIAHRPAASTPDALDGTVAMAVLALLPACLLATLRSRRGLAPIVSLCLLVVILGSAGCGGNGTPGGSGTTTATLTGTASSGTPTASMTFTVEIE